jgi:hypothetical protein
MSSSRETFESLGAMPDKCMLLLVLVLVVVLWWLWRGSCGVLWLLRGCCCGYGVAALAVAVAVVVVGGVVVGMLSAS